MKKLYISPETNVVKLRSAQHMLSGSANGATIRGGNASTSNEVLSRRNRSFWDDEDE